MHQNSSGKAHHSRLKILLSLIILISLSLFVASQVAFAAEHYDFVAKWGKNGGNGSFGSGDGEFSLPSGIAIDSSGNIYVADSGNNRVQKLDPNGNFITKWVKNITKYGPQSTIGTGDGEFFTPCDIAIDSSGNIYVADSDNSRIQKFDSSGNFIAKWGKNGGDGSYGTGDGEFYYPDGVAVDSFDNVYVADRNNHRIQKFDSSGKLVAKWGRSGGNGSFGTGNGEFNYPHGVAVDSSGNIFVADTSNNRIQKLDPNGNFIAKWGNNGGDGSYGTGDGEFSLPYSVAIDSSGNIYIADSGNYRIQKLDSNGNFITKWGNNSGFDTSGSGDGELCYPSGIAIDSSGNVYVADTINSRIQKFEKSDATESTEPTTPSTFSDIPSTAWYKTHVDTLVSKGVISGFPDNTFRPNTFVTRAEFSKMLCLALAWTPINTTTSSFKDVAQADWFSPYVETAKANGTLSGYPDGIFGPNKTITRAEIAVAISRVKGLSSKKAIYNDTNGHWADGPIGACANAGILSGYPGGFFKPDWPTTRAEAAKFIAALL